MTDRKGFYILDPAAAYSRKPTGLRMFIVSRNGDLMACFAHNENELPSESCGYGVGRDFLAEWLEYTPSEVA